MQTTTSVRIKVLFSVMALLLAGMVSAEQARAETVWGKSAALGQGRACAFVEKNAHGRPIALGIMLSAKALQGLPTKPAEPPETMLALPDKISVPPFKYIAVNWNPQGHEPKIYAVPHFDFHFYIIPNAEREKITAGNTAQFAKAPAARYLPADYMQAPGGVPKMGAHWVDKTAREMKGGAFTATFIYGTYNGRVAFYEPMVAMGFLKTKPDFSAPIKQPEAFEVKGLYPVLYRVTYDKRRAEYKIILEGLTPR